MFIDILRASVCVCRIKWFFYMQIKMYVFGCVYRREKTDKCRDKKQLDAHHHPKNTTCLCLVHSFAVNSRYGNKMAEQQVKCGKKRNGSVALSVKFLVNVIRLRVSHLFLRETKESFPAHTSTEIETLTIYTNSQLASHIQANERETLCTRISSFAFIDREIAEMWQLWMLDDGLGLVWIRSVWFVLYVRMAWMHTCAWLWMCVFLINNDQCGLWR